MSVALIAWASIAATLIYILIVEPLFFDFALLQVTRFTQLVERLWVMAKIHPRAPWVQFQIRRNANRIATQLFNEINGTTGKSDDDDHLG